MPDGSVPFLMQVSTVQNLLSLQSMVLTQHSGTLSWRHLPVVWPGSISHVSVVHGWSSPQSMSWEQHSPIGML